MRVEAGRETRPGRSCTTLTLSIIVWEMRVDRLALVVRLVIAGNWAWRCRQVSRVGSAAQSTSSGFGRCDRATAVTIQVGSRCRRRPKPTTKVLTCSEVAKGKRSTEVLTAATLDAPSRQRHRRHCTRRKIEARGPAAPPNTVRVPTHKVCRPLHAGARSRRNRQSVSLPLRIPSWAGSGPGWQVPLHEPLWAVAPGFTHVFARRLARAARAAAVLVGFPSPSGRRVYRSAATANKCRL